MPWEPRIREAIDFPEPGLIDAVGCVDDLPAVAAVFVVIVAIAVFLFFVVPLLVTLVELLLLAVLVVLGVLVRLVLRRPWIVDAVRVDRSERLSWKVGGFRRSGEVAEAVAVQLGTGQEPVALPDATRC
jgi:hypothetical protein